MAASPIWHPYPFEWNWSDLRQTCSVIGNSEIRSSKVNERVRVKMSSEFYFVPEERRFARDEEKWKCEISVSTSQPKWLWCICGGCFSALFSHGVRRRSEFPKWKWKVNVQMLTWKLVPRDSSSTTNKFKIQPLKAILWDGFQRQWILSHCHLHYQS